MKTSLKVKNRKTNGTNVIKIGETKLQWQPRTKLSLVPDVTPYTPAPAGFGFVCKPPVSLQVRVHNSLSLEDRVWR